ncbi:MAG: hypothetical protein D6824_02125 [Planctomycetota bacterium]|nr:MAG: hypothetical protein D6824_02125 [Planctomycetota bacterium]
MSPEASGGIAAQRPSLWAFFLASSWLWCIGMYLPALLVRDFGLPGWGVFALCNVTGATAVGALRGHVAGAVQQRVYAGWARAFSLTTIAFHTMFLAWIGAVVGDGVLGDSGVAAAGLLAALCWAAAAGLAGRGERTLLRTAAAVYAASIAALALAGLTSQWRQYQPAALHGEEPLAALPVAGAALALGFLLCPQLDLTLLRAREALGPQRRARVFVAGFGGLFLLMIVASLFYGAGIAGGWLNLWLVAHFAVQSAFTMGAHQRELARRRLAGGWVGAVAAGLGMLAGIAAAALGAGELVYKAFLACYAVVFPVAALLMWRSSEARPRATLLTAGAALALFVPGQLQGRWLLTAAGVALAAGLPWVVAQRSRRSDGGVQSI